MGAKQRDRRLQLVREIITLVNLHTTSSEEKVTLSAMDGLANAAPTFSLKYYWSYLGASILMAVIFLPPFLLQSLLGLTQTGTTQHGDMWKGRHEGGTMFSVDGVSHGGDPCEFFGELEKKVILCRMEKQGTCITR
ncbi:hypothetical protein BHM03_00007079 [Ensete ventricosum]|uniref:Uncharacterized protein n=1 Tax=Ensete ventricosum TaxID=4639 RepID=A0A445MBW4_ENSVE|nr:hypothetical protein BHM03_00007079 [Ensete ventricosum]